MRVNKLSRKPLRKIVSRILIKKSQTDTRDQGTESLTLECGHVVIKKRAETKTYLFLKCGECEEVINAPRDQEYGPHRNRSRVPVLHRLSLGCPEEEECLD
jgi:hypothetical protein